MRCSPEREKQSKDIRCPCSAQKRELKQKLEAEAEARRIEAMKITKEKPAAKLRMQELRDMNQTELTQDDRDKRLKDANAVTKVPSTFTMAEVQGHTICIIFHSNCEVPSPAQLACCVCCRLFHLEASLVSRWLKICSSRTMTIRMMIPKTHGTERTERTELALSLHCSKMQDHCP